MLFTILNIYIYYYIFSCNIILNTSRSAQRKTPCGVQKNMFLFLKNQKKRQPLAYR